MKHAHLKLNIICWIALQIQSHSWACYREGFVDRLSHLNHLCRFIHLTFYTHVLFLLPVHNELNFHPNDIETEENLKKKLEGSKLADFHCFTLSTDARREEKWALEPTESTYRYLLSFAGPLQRRQTEMCVSKMIMFVNHSTAVFFSTNKVPQTPSRQHACLHFRNLFNSVLLSLILNATHLSQVFLIKLSLFDSLLTKL